jgi:hypothetical protein
MNFALTSSEIITFAGFAGCSAAALWFVPPILRTAWRTGELVSRGVVYDRRTQPLMFHLGWLSWVALLVLAVGPTVYLLLAALLIPFVP